MWVPNPGNMHIQQLFCFHGLSWFLSLSLSLFFFTVFTYIFFFPPPIPSSRYYLILVLLRFSGCISMCFLKERTCSLLIRLWLKSLFIYLPYEQYDLTPENLSRPYLPGRYFPICEARTMTNVEIAFLIKVMCWHIKMANEMVLVL